MTNKWTRGCCAALPRIFAICIVAFMLLAPSRAQNPPTMQEMPYFQYLIDPDELAVMGPGNRITLLRPYVSNFWFNPTVLGEWMSWYRQQVPGATLGRYFVPYNATPEPILGSLPNKMSNIPDAWLLRNWSGGYFTLQYGTEIRRNLDLTLPEVRAAQIRFWIEQSAGWDQLLIDHFIYKYTNQFNSCIHGSEAWFAAMLALLQEYKAATTKPIVVNVIGPPWEIWDELTPWVDGFFSESALSTSIYFPQTHWRSRYFRWELAAYRRALNAGKAVLLTNNNSWAGVTNDAYLSTPEVVGPVLSAVVCLVRNPGERLYFNTNITRNHDHTPRAYHEWWRLLGRPLGKYYWVDLVARREFERGWVEFDITTSQPDIRVKHGVTGYCGGFASCDLDCNGTVNTFDIEPFVQRMKQSSAAGCGPCAGDTTGDGTVNQFDINPFLSCIGT